MSAVDTALDLPDQILHPAPKQPPLGKAADGAVPRDEIADVHLLDLPHGLHPGESVSLDEGRQPGGAHEVAGEGDLLLRHIDQGAVERMARQMGHYEIEATDVKGELV